MDKALKRYVLPIVSVLAIIVLDQWTKLLILNHFIINKKQDISIINKVLRICFVQNEGMAWGLFQNMQIVFIIITPLVIAGLIYIFYKMPFEKKYIPMRVCVLFLMGGAIGNLIDRIDLIDRVALLNGSVTSGNIFHGYVVDMIYAEIINFPVFNIADSFITVGFALLLVLIIFVYKEKDFDVVFSFKKKEESKEEITEENPQEVIKTDENN